MPSRKWSRSRKGSITAEYTINGIDAGFDYVYAAAKAAWKIDAKARLNAVAERELAELEDWNGRLTNHNV